ncbi:FMN-linked oxidoreductase [Aureobasidium pullulans]|nr:FMN-linked oxidoreductase [Aureobasidium pullulans]THY91062.1 FMN-linked oxidoreductase [Aureobasidium pullulans]
MAKRVSIPKNGVDYRGKVVLAPMVRSGECPSRLMALKYGADLVWGPETIDKALIGTTRRVNTVTNTIDFTRISSNGSKNPDVNPSQRESIIYRLYPSREGRQLIHQIGTSDPERAVAASKLIAPDVAGIDVNAGCPKPFSTLGGMGAALLKTPDKLVAILEALVKEVGTPFEIGISVKIRILENPEDTAALVRRLVATGITGLTVHCRTTPMRPRESAIRDQLRMVGEICHEAGVACLMNGDVTSRDEALKLAEEYGVDGAMIATAAEANPSCFRAEKDGGLAPWDQVVKEYIRTALEVENRWGNTKYLLGQMIPGRAKQYRPMNQAKSYTDIVEIMEYEEEFVTLAREVDEKLEISFGKKETRSERKQRANQTKKEKKQEAKEAEDKQSLKRKADDAELSAPPDAKRQADDAELNMPLDVSRSEAPGSVTTEQVLAV